MPTAYTVHGPDRPFTTEETDVADAHARAGHKVTAVTHA